MMEQYQNRPENDKRGSTIRRRCSAQRKQIKHAKNLAAGHQTDAAGRELARDSAA
jgi:hypothetical protein